MKIGWIGGNNNNLVSIDLTSGKRMLWPAGTWSKSRLKDEYVVSGEETTYGIFDPLNKYLETLSEETIDKLENTYQEIFETLSDASDLAPDMLTGLLYGYISDICELVDYYDLHRWCTNTKKGYLNFDIGIKDVLRDIDTRETTYFTQEYVDVVVFSIYIKLLMPVWGYYHQTKKHDLGEDQTLLSALNITNNDIIATNPAMVKLVEYVSSWGNKRVTSINFVITSGMSVGEFIEYCIITTLWKKIIIFDPRGQEYLVENFYNILEDRFARANRSSPNDKISLNNGGDEKPALADTYKLVDAQPPKVPVLITFAINRDDFPYLVNANISPRDLNNMYQYIEGLEMRESHLTIVSAVCKRVLRIRDPLYADRISMKKLIAVSACSLIQLNLCAVADFITAKPIEKNVNLIFSAGIPIIPVRNDLIQKAHQKYSVVGNIDALLNTKDKLVSELSVYNWNFKYGKIENFANEVLELFLMD